MKWFLIDGGGSEGKWGEVEEDGGRWAKKKNRKN